MNVLDIKQAINDFRHNQLGMGIPASPEDDKRYRQAAITHCQALLGELGNLVTISSRLNKYPYEALQQCILQRDKELQIIRNVEITANYGCEEDTLLAEKAVTNYNEETGLSPLTEVTMRLVTSLRDDILRFLIAQYLPLGELAQYTWVSAKLNSMELDYYQSLVVAKAINETSTGK